MLAKLLRVALAVLGPCVILIGVGFCLYARSRVAQDGVGITLVVMAVLGWFPLAVGFLMLRWRRELDGERDPRPPSQTGLFKFGIALVIFAILATGACLATAGRLVLVLLLFLVFTRLHLGWASERFRTPFGTYTWAQIFDGTVLGAAYLAFRLIIELILAALTGGRSLGVTFGGGKFGGGGASGRW